MREQTVYVLCIRNENYPASLDLYKVYRAIPDDCAAQDQLLRGIDESGEDYLYPMNCFRLVKSPTTVEELEDIEDLAIAADFLKRRQDANSPQETGMLPWEDVANEWDEGKEPEE